MYDCGRELTRKGGDANCFLSMDLCVVYSRTLHAVGSILLVVVYLIVSLVATLDLIGLFTVVTCVAGACLRLLRVRILCDIRRGQSR